MIQALLLLLAAVLRPESRPPTFKNSVPIEFVLIQPGQMRVAVFHPACPSPGDPAVTAKAGGPAAAEAAWTAHDFALCQEFVRKDWSDGFTVRISKPFYIARFEITQAQWMKVMGRNPSVFQRGRVNDEAARHPVDNVSWDQAQAFIRKLNDIEETHSYRLPTEFEWEYAGRAGGPGQVGWDDIRKQAVQGLRMTKEGVKPATQIVGSKQPNAWGLYDMLGNVWEWVDDFYNEKTFPDPVPPTEGTQHVLKGGGFLSDIKNTIYATHAAGPGDGWDVGFRIVKDVE